MDGWLDKGVEDEVAWELGDDVMKLLS